MLPRAPVCIARSWATANFLAQSPPARQQHCNKQMVCLRKLGFPRFAQPLLRPMSGDPSMFGINGLQVVCFLLDTWWEFVSTKDPGGYSSLKSGICVHQRSGRVCVHQNIRESGRVFLTEICRLTSLRLPAMGVRPSCWTILPPSGLLAGGCFVGGNFCGKC